ncbi:hypothetical protein D3C87_1420190 [compost metagenome]
MVAVAAFAMLWEMWPLPALFVLFKINLHASHRPLGAMAASGTGVAPDRVHAGDRSNRDENESRFVRVFSMSSPLATLVRGS